jgi:hypothetical protein
MFAARQAAWESGRRRHLLEPAWLAGLSYALAFARQSPTVPTWQPVANDQLVKVRKQDYGKR